jgi:hypothetical protein
MGLQSSLEKESDDMEAIMTSMTPALHTDHQLDQLAGQFDHWRQTRAHLSERIPHALWDQAVALTATVPPARVAKQLRLRLADLKKQMAYRQGSAAAVVPQPVGFVEVPLAPTELARPEVVRLELSRPDGTRLSLHVPASLLSLDTVIHAFVESRACCN